MASIKIVNYLVYIFNTHIVSTTVYMYLLSSITRVSVYTPDPPNAIIQLVVGVTLHTKRECQYLIMTVSGILNYRIKTVIININTVLLEQTLSDTHTHSIIMHMHIINLMDY